MKKDLILKYYQDYKLYIFPIIVALSSLILIVFVIYPQIISFVNNNRVQGQIVTKSNLLEAKAQTLESYDEQDLRNKVNVVLDTYPTGKDYISALSLLNNIITQAGFSIVSMTVGSTSVKNTNSQSYNINLDISGPAELIPVLLNNIENSPRLMKVNNVEAVLGKDRVSTVSMTAEVFYSSVPKDFGGIETPVSELSQKEEEIIVKLAQAANSSRSTPSETGTTELGPRGKANPFE